MSILDRLVGQVIVLVRVCLSVCVVPQPSPGHDMSVSLASFVNNKHNNCEQEIMAILFKTRSRRRELRNASSHTPKSSSCFTLSRLREACHHATKRWARNEWTRGAPRLITASQCPSMCSSCQLMAAAGSFSAESSSVVRWLTVDAQE